MHWMPNTWRWRVAKRVEGQIIGFLGGRDDLANGRLSAIGNPMERFAEDKLRVLRAARFAARFGHKIDPETLAPVHEMAPQIHVVSVERIAQYFRKLLPDKNRVLGMQLLMESGLLKEQLPEAMPMIGLQQSKPKQPGEAFFISTQAYPESQAH